MLRVRRILHPTDFSHGAKPALAAAVRLASENHADLYLVHVVATLATLPTYSGMPLVADPRIYDQYSEACETTLQELAGQIDDSSVRVHLEVHQAITVGEVIVERAKQLDVDVVVMGSHGRRGVQRLLMGSVAERVIRDMDRPVWVVGRRAGAAESATLSKILVALDFSEYSSVTLMTARTLAARYNASLEVVHALHLEPHPFFGANTLEDMVSRLDERCREELRALWENTGGPDVPYLVHISTGRPAKVISDLVLAREIDLVVVNSHGHGVDRRLLGSQSEAILRRAGCPVLTLRADGKSLLSPDDIAAKEQQPAN